MPQRNCPKCSKAMKQPLRKMSQIDTCDSCKLVYLDAVELGFMIGSETIENNLARHAKEVQGCAHCGVSFEGDTHCKEQQRFNCLACNTQMQEIRITILMPRQEQDPYRGSSLEGSYKEKTYICLYRCASCEGLLLTEDLLTLFMVTFSTKPHPNEKTDVDRFRDALLSIFIQDEKRTEDKKPIKF
jgi:Zn-finger nucleic acid-binding protein